jgi:ParB family chromosome partitioning protein
MTTLYRSTGQEEPMKNETQSRTVKDIPVAQIERDPDNRVIDETDERIAALVDNVRVFGVLQRLHVRALERGYQLIDGERRLCAAITVGLEVVPCEVWPSRASRGDVVAAGIVMNDQRQAHSPVHVARRLRDLKNSDGLTAEQVAGRMGMPLDRVKTYFALFGGSDFLIAFLERHDVPLKVAAELVRYERATNEARGRKLAEQWLEAPLTREQIVELRRRATGAETERGSEAAGLEGKGQLRSVRRAIERALQRDPQTTISAIEEALRPHGFLIVAA